MESKLNFVEQIIDEDNKHSPIISSLLDLDFYKLTMGQFVYHRYKDVPVKYGFTNRTKIRLAEVIDEKDLRREFDTVKDLEFKSSELVYLKRLFCENGERLFKDDYLSFLSNVRLPDYSLKVYDGNFKIEVSGPWSTSIYWETLTLSIMNELYTRAVTKNYSKEQMQSLYNQGTENLDNKIKSLKEHPEIKFIEFGTRRRFSNAWQDNVLERLLEEIPHRLIGTSNVNLAKKYNIKPSGTMAHELFMVMSGIMHKNDDEIRASHNQVLSEWYDEYGPSLSIALTDTYGSDFFFRDFSKKQAEEYYGLRQDSGSPISFGKKQLEFYKSHGIDSKNKLLVPSDGLTLDSIMNIQNKFQDKINPVYGWGTNLTNDLGLPSLSIIVKAIESCGNRTVKLSDNPAKAQGKTEDIQRFMKIFSYDPNKYRYEACRY